MHLIQPHIYVFSRALLILTYKRQWPGSGDILCLIGHKICRIALCSFDNFIGEYGSEGPNAYNFNIGIVH